MVVSSSIAAWLFINVLHPTQHCPFTFDSNIAKSLRNSSYQKKIKLGFFFVDNNEENVPKILKTTVSSILRNGALLDKSTATQGHYLKGTMLQLYISFECFFKIRPPTAQLIATFMFNGDLEY